MTSAIAVPNRELVNYPHEFNRQTADALEIAASEITALQGGAGALDWKNSVLCATTGALAANTRTGNVLTADANGALGAIDGVSPVVGNRMLVKNEVTQANNGIYDVTSVGDGSSPWILTRSTDADEDAEVTPNLAVMVERGSINQDKTYILDINGPVVLNTTALVFDDWRGLAVTAPVDVTKAAAAVGTATTLARADHKHDVSTAVVVTIGTANVEGAATSLARSDHVHDHGAQTEPTHHAVATVSANGFLSSTDKAKLDSIQTGTATLTNGTVAVATANITASSRIQVTHTAINASTALGIPCAESLTPGTPGSFTINARNPADATVQVNDQSDVFWEVVG